MDLGGIWRVVEGRCDLGDLSCVAATSINNYHPVAPGCASLRIEVILSRDGPEIGAAVDQSHNFNPEGNAKVSWKKLGIYLKACVLISHMIVCKYVGR